MVKSDKIKNKSNMFARVNEVMLLMSWRHQNMGRRIGHYCDVSNKMLNVKSTCQTFYFIC